MSVERETAEGGSSNGARRKLASETPLSLSRILPLPNASISKFERLRLWFTQPIEGVQSLSIEANGQPPLSSLGQGGGPYDFWFPPMEEGRIEIVVEGENLVANSQGQNGRISRRWHYQQGALFPVGSVRLTDLRLRVPAEYDGVDEYPKTWLSVENLSDAPLQTLGWQVRFDSGALPTLPLPSRSIPAGAKSLIEINDLMPTTVAFQALIPAGQGRLTLLDSDFPARTIDTVDYAFSSGDPELSLTRVDSQWLYHVTEAGATAESVESRRRLPEKPVPDFPPGIYAQALDVSFSAVKPDDQIWYTLDGTSPWNNASLYEGPIRIEKGTVIKACVRRGGLTSRVATASYQIGKGETVSTLPTMAFTNVGFDQKDNAELLKFAENGGALGSSVEVWGPDDVDMLEGDGLISELGPLEGGLRFKGRGFRLRLLGNGDQVEAVYRRLGLVPMHPGLALRCLPAFVTSRREVVDWMVDEIGLPNQHSGGEVFINIVINGKSVGPYRIVPERSGMLNEVTVDGAQVSVIGEGEAWRRLMRWILDSSFVDPNRLVQLEREFDVSGFIDFYLMGLFWGDRSWPLKTQEVLFDPRTKRWAFLLSDLGQAGFLWEADQFPPVGGRVNAAGLVFESLVRSSDFRRRIEERFHLLFEQEREPLQARIESVVDGLNHRFGNRFRPLGDPLNRDAVAKRFSLLQQHLIGLGLLPSLAAPLVSWADGETEDRRLEVGGDRAEVFFSRLDSDPVQWLDDLWLIGPGSEKRVLIPTSARNFESWKQPGFSDRDWIRVNGLLGFDPKGLSGRRIESKFHDLIYNRSTGAYLRIPFEVTLSDLTNVDRLLLRCRINDGFVASLNGKDFLRMNVPEVVQWNSVASQDLRGTAWRFREFDVTHLRDQLVEGRNILGIHALNSMMNGPSFLVDVEIVGRKEARGNLKSEAMRYEEPIAVGTEGAVMTFRSRAGDQWSRLTQFRAPALERAQKSPVVRRLHFSASEVPGLDCFEMENPGGGTIDCHSLRVSPLRIKGAEGVLLEAGESIWFVSESGLESFRLRWPNRRIGGVFTGMLAACPELELWHDSTLVDRIRPRWIAETFNRVPLEEDSLIRQWGADGESLWNRESVSGIDVGSSGASYGARIRMVGLTKKGSSLRIEIGDDRPTGSPSGPIWIGHGFRGHIDWHSLDAAVGSVEFGWSDVDVRGGETHHLCLQDQWGNWLDSETFGPLPKNVSMLRDRATHRWSFAGKENVGQGKTGESRVVRVRLNEAMISSKTPDENWIELYNPEPRAQELTQALVLQIKGLRWSPFRRGRIDPSGYVVTPLPLGLRDGLVGARPDEMLSVELHSGDKIVDRMTVLGSQISGEASFGQWPDGGANTVEFLGTSSPGSENYISLGGRGRMVVGFSEVMAINATSYRGGGDWLELHNSTEKAILLDRMSVSIGGVSPGQWRFPPGSRLLPKGYLFLRCVGTEPASRRFDSRMNLGRDLDEGGDQVYLFDSKNRIVDQVVFGPQLVDQSIIRDGRGEWVSTLQPSAGARNRGATTRLRTPVLLVSQVQAGDDGIQVRLNNKTGEVARIDGWRLVVLRDGALTGHYRFPELSFIGQQQAIVVPWNVKQNHGQEAGDEVRLINAEGRMVQRVFMGDRG